MSETRYDAQEIAQATRQGLVEVFGEDSPTVDLLVSKAIGHLGVEASGGTTPDAPEVYAFNQPPRYAERALRSNSPEELASLAAEAATRLKRSISNYLDNTRYRNEEAGEMSLRPWVFSEGATTGDGEHLIGEMNIEILPLDAKSRYSDTVELVSLTLIGGEGAAFNRFDDGEKERAHYTQRLSIKRRDVNDPLTGTEAPIMYVSSWAGYEGGTEQTLTLHREEGKNGSLTTAVKANVFWALDTAITYYESVYHCGSHHVGLTYADYRDAGCVDEQGNFSWEKATAWVEEQTPINGERVGDWPVLGDYNETRLTMDPDYRAQIQADRTVFY